MHPLEPGTSPVPGCCAHAVCLTITRAAQLVVRVAVVLDQVLHVAMFNLRRLRTAPLCRQRTVSWPRGPGPGRRPHLWQVPPQSCLPCPAPAPCQAAPGFVRAPVLPPLPWKVPVAVAVSSTVQARPAISSAAGLQGREGTLSRGLPPPCSQSVGSTRTSALGQAHALSRGVPPQEGRGPTPHPRGCPSDAAWRSRLGQTRTLLLWRTRLQRWEPERFQARHGSCHSPRQGQVLSRASRTDTAASSCRDTSTSLTPCS